MRMLMVLLACVCSSALLAYNELTGQEAPAFNANVCVNPPADGRVTMADCLGGVVLLKYWGPNWPPCVKALPSNQRLFEELSPKGLHMFLLHAQSEDKEWMEKYAKDRGLTLPIPMKLECNFEAYDGNRRISLPYAYVIGPDGIVAWQGKTGYEAEVRKQLARIKYPKLRRMEVLPQVAKAAADFEAGNYASARAAAVKLRESSMQDGATDEALFADAQFVIDAVDDHLFRLRGRIDELKSARRYHEALPLLEELSSKAYAGLDASTEAKNELKKLKADKDVKSELKAWGDFEKMLEANKKVKEPSDRRKNIEKFIARNEGTAAAEEAATLLEAD